MPPTAPSASNFPFARIFVVLFVSVDRRSLNKHNYEYQKILQFLQSLALASPLQSTVVSHRVSRFVLHQFKFFCTGKLAECTE